jgi:hypothetical protein
MQSLRERTTLAEKRGGYVHRANTCEDELAFEPVGHRGKTSDTLDCRRGQSVRTSESVSLERLLWAVLLWQTAVHQSLKVEWRFAVRSSDGRTNNLCSFGPDAFIYRPSRNGTHPGIRCEKTKTLFD